MESNIYNAVQHIPLKRLNLFALIVALDEQKDTMTDEKTSKAQSGSLMRNVGCPPDEFSQWPPMSQLCHNDSSLYEEEVRPHETIIGPNSNLPCGRQFAGQENNLKSPFAISIKQNFITPSQGFHLQGYNCYYNNKANEVEIQITKQEYLDENRIKELSLSLTSPIRNT